MDDRAAARIRAAVAGKDMRYFSTHSLGGLLEEIGEDRSPAAILEAARRLADDDAYRFIGAVASGLREAFGGCGGAEFASLVSGVAGRIRHGLAQGPVVRSLIEAGKDDPGRAVSAAARLVDLGDADYAAFLAGGAYAGEPAACESMAESLLSSGDSGRAAAGVGLLRVARLEHRAPCAGRIADAADRALRIGGGPVWREAMEALLDVYKEDPRRIGPMIEGLAVSRADARPLLAVRMGGRSPFNGPDALRFLDVCIAGTERGDGSAAYDICRALAALAAGEPAGVAGRMLGLVRHWEYRRAYGWRVFEELGKASPAAAAAAAGEVLSALRRPDGGGIRPHLPQIVRSLGRHADLDSLAAPLLAALESEPGLSDDCLAALGALAEENQTSRKDAGFARSLLGRLREIGARAAGAEAPPGQDPHAACGGLIERMRRAGPGAAARTAAGKTDLVLLILHARGGRPVDGITRLVKLLFLAQAEEGPRGRRAPLDGPFDFVAHRYGPFAPDIYDEIEFLKSVDMAEADGNLFAITPKGSRYVEQRLLGRVPDDQLESIEKIKAGHGEEDLDGLLRYVYTRYPEFTVKSEILERVMGRGG